jgi:Xaa-Pro aminopeptidase
MNEQIFRERIARLRAALLAPLGLDLLLAYSDDPLNAGAVRYLTDFDVYAMYALVMVPRQGDVALAFGLHHSAYLVRVKEAANADYYLGTYKPGELCRTLLAESGASRAPQIGLIGGRDLFQEIDADIRKQLPGARFVDIDREFWSSVHGESAQSRNDTVSRLIRSACITVESIDVAQKHWQGCHSASELAAQVGFAARRRGADILNREIVQVSLATGIPLPVYLTRSHSQSPKPSGALAIEVRAAYRGINSVVGRTFVADTRRSKAILGAARERHRETCGLLKSGCSVDGIVEAAAHDGALGNAATETLELGHGTGFGVRTQPTLRTGTDIKLQDGSAFVVRTKMREPELGVIHFADTVLVADTGTEIITDRTEQPARLIEN